MNKPNFWQQATIPGDPCRMCKGLSRKRKNLAGYQMCPKCDVPEPRSPVPSLV